MLKQTRRHMHKHQKGMAAAVCIRDEADVQGTGRWRSAILVWLI